MAQKVHHPTPEELEADIERQRRDLARTVSSLQARLDVKARAREKAAELKERATTDTGRPRPAVVATATAAGAGALAGAVLIARHRHTQEGTHMNKLSILAAGGIGYVLGTRAGRERYEQLKHSAQHVAESPRVRDLSHQAAEGLKHQAPLVKQRVSTAASAAASKIRHTDGARASDQFPEDPMAHRATDPELATDQAAEYPSAYAAARREEPAAQDPLMPSERNWSDQPRP